MSKIVLVSYRPSGQLIAKGFEANGQKPVCFYADIPKILLIKPFAVFLEKIKGYFYNKALKKGIKRVDKDDVLIMVKGNYLSQKLKTELINLKAKKVAITLDSLDRAPMQKDICLLSDLVAFQDKGDLDLENLKGRGFHLPLGFDENLFKPGNQFRDTDVLLVGNFYPKTYGKRLELIHLIGNDRRFSGLKISIIGSSGDAALNEKLKQQYPSINFLGKLSFSQINEELNRAKVAVNIHQDDGKEPVNPWLFIISGTKTAQIVDSRDYLTAFFAPGEEIIMAEFKDIPDNILNLLDNNFMRESVAAKGYSRTLKDHSSSSRAKTILNQLQTI